MKKITLLSICAIFCTIAYISCRPDKKHAMEDGVKLTNTQNVITTVTPSLKYASN